MQRYEGRVGEAGGARLDVYVAETLGILTRSQLKSHLASASVNGKPAKLSRAVHPGDLLALEWEDAETPSFDPEDIPLSVLYEDDRAIVIDKPQGMVVHPAHGNWHGTLANALLGRLIKERGKRGAEAAPDRAGIVHRLDKDTSGIIIAAKDAVSQAFLSRQFQDRKVGKEYLAITYAPLPASSGRMENQLGRDPRDRKRFAVLPQGGKVAITDWKVLAAYGPYRVVALRLHTGRTHQIRVHLKALGCPILGDPLYGRRDPRFPDATLMLHSRRLRILLPGHDEPSMFKSALPERFHRVLEALEEEFGPSTIG
jgi:23S rRNA pseudouridine1911/1915/1917 synthase